MGEAKRRREVAARQPRPVLDDDIKWDIATVVHAVQLEGEGGMCWIRSYVGAQVLAMCGLRPRIGVGSMLYRAGPDPRRDVVAFCGEWNMGCYIDGNFVGHAWLELGPEADPDVIDFTSCEWRERSEGLYALSREEELRRAWTWVAVVGGRSTPN